MPTEALHNGATENRRTNGIWPRFPHAVDTGTYDHTIEVLRAAVTRAGIDRSERVAALKRLVRFGEERVKKRLARECSAEKGQPFSRVLEVLSRTAT